MNPQEKAKELVDKFDKPTRYWDQAEGWQSDLSSAKLAAIIAVDIFIQIAEGSDELVTKLIGLLPLADRVYFKDADRSKAATYWKNVKEEINKL